MNREINSFSKKEIEEVVETAINLGFQDVRFIPAFNPGADFQGEYQSYLLSQFQGDLGYLENTEPKFNLNLIYPGVNSIAVFSLPYLKPDFFNIVSKKRFKISAYAAGLDYHSILKKKLHIIAEKYGSGRVVCDTTPLPERYYGYQAGLGFLGKNSMLIEPLTGSYFFLAFILFRKKLPDGYGQGAHLKNVSKPDRRKVLDDMNRYCGSCSKCVDACPGGALDGTGYLNTSKCYSFWSIENRSDNINFKFKRISSLFGCDICQNVCPYNQTPAFTKISEFNITDTAEKIMNGSIEEITDSGLKNSPFKRAGLKGLLRNLKYINNQ